MHIVLHWLQSHSLQMECILLQHLSKELWSESILFLNQPRWMNSFSLDTQYILSLVSFLCLQSYSFRRGTYPSTIYSLSFGPSTQLPDILIATSSSGSIHAFSLMLAINQRWGLRTTTLYFPYTVSDSSSSCFLCCRSKRSTSFLGSVLPDSVSDALDPAHHHVLQNAVSSGIRRWECFFLLDAAKWPIRLCL